MFAVIVSKVAFQGWGAWRGLPLVSLVWAGGDLGTFYATCLLQHSTHQSVIGRHVVQLRDHQPMPALHGWGVYSWAWLY